MLQNLPSPTINLCAEHRKRERAILCLVFWIDVKYFFNEIGSLQFSKQTL